jgi:hypothetical protein
VIAAVLETSATAPPASASGTVLVASGAGSGPPTAPPPASCSSRKPPGAIVPESGITSQAPFEPEETWTDHPSRLTVPLPRLCSSTKSLANGAPAAPPAT